MILTILGSGTSLGVPIIQCKCQVCRSKHFKNKRLRASAWIQILNAEDGKKKNILIDTSTDLRQQALRYQISGVDAVLFTHPHADHAHGIDELRAFRFLKENPIPIYGNEWTCTELTGRFHYAFNSILTTHCFQASIPFLDILGESIIPISLQHGSEECVGYRLRHVAYVVDCNCIPPLSLDRMRGLSVLFLDCLGISPHSTHLNLNNALRIIEEVKPQKTFLTHLSHDFDYFKSKKLLPKGVFFAYDGLEVHI